MPDPIFTSLGLFIIDENRYPPKLCRQNEYNIIGGGASYAIEGARIVSGPQLAQLVTGIVDKGRDFPAAVEDELRGWNTGVVFRLDKNRLTTRGVNIYDDNDIRHFEYQTPKLRVEVEDIVATENLIRAKSFHFCCAIDRFLHSVEIILVHNPTAFFVFEPAPDGCTAEYFPALVQALPQISVFTPNLNEACAFVGLSLTENLPETEDQIRQVAANFWPHMTGENSGLVIRCGPLGCYVKTLGLDMLLPAYHQNQAKVVDVTGGGNSFCGAFAAALCLSQDWLIAGIFGNLVSGCIIERLGVAKLTDQDHDAWNGLTIRQRLDIYLHQNKSLLEGKVDLLKMNWI